MDLSNTMSILIVYFYQVGLLNFNIILNVHLSNKFN